MRYNASHDIQLEIEIPKENFPVEWWFFQGSYQRNHKDFYFMISVFRNNVAFDNEPLKNGFSAIISHLDKEKGINTTLSQIDKKTHEGIIRGVQRLDNIELDKDLLKVLHRELEFHGPPIPIKLKLSEASMTLTPFTIEWDTIKISQNQNGFQAEFYLSEIETHFSFSMIPTYNRILIDVEDDEKVFNGKMSYATYPNMELAGIVNGENVNGVCWFDHQWGDTCWFVNGDVNQKVLGWDWFGINLENGIDIIVVEHKLMRENKRLTTNVMVRSDNNELMIIKEAELNPIRFWESPKTHIQYPIEWEIKIARINLELVFRPYYDDQEIITIGSSRAIWEGAGYVSGTYYGEKINGHARAEFFGYGYIFDFQNYLQKLADIVDKRIEEFFPKKFNEEQIQKFVGKPFWKHEPVAYSKMLSEPIWDLIMRRGKRWRPIFGILMLEALGKISKNFIGSSCLAELVHSGALIIDDIEDNSLLRRGEPALHIKYGINTALNAGNILYFLPSVELFNHKFLDDNKKLRIHEIMMDTYIQAHFGQTVDLYWSKYLSEETLQQWMNDSLEEKILQMYDYKTAAGAKGLAEVAAVIAEADQHITQTCINFARSFAVAFQIIDDVHNFSDSPKWTKICGEDLSNGKLTYVIVKAIKMLDDQKSKRLIKILCNQELREDNKILEEGIRLVRESGALEISKDFAKKMSMSENEIFNRTVPSCEPKIMLSMLCIKMLDLAYDT